MNRSMRTLAGVGIAAVVFCGTVSTGGESCEAPERAVKQKLSLSNELKDCNFDCACLSYIDRGEQPKRVGVIVANRHKKAILGVE